MAKGGAAGSGIDAQGNCQGTCKGRCSVTAPSARCSGSCRGSCDAPCKATASASAICSGTCDRADFEPLTCEGGKLEGGCKTDARCDAYCDASVWAKAECPPPPVKVSVSGARDFLAAGKLQETLEANLGLVVAFRARLEGMAALQATISGSADAVADIKDTCIPPVLAAAKEALLDVKAADDAASSIATAAQ